MLWLKIEKELMRQKISVYRLAKNTGIKQTTLQNYKNGTEPSFKNMCKIADALGVSLDYFRDEGEDKENVRTKRKRDHHRSDRYYG
ncbi:helix-turn-helix domain-containing protein [Ligilactobacillus animalis]|uniref:helix-turn-helix domain-containing protein n=1 Tax=Ligilactobacillus animalis TaxID=1605 RepID=UPI00242CB2AF|nr:helix-turn-helix transcriptional regulator [Ligilactobacillus animalis]MDU8985807.1 helix-turn-helix transcriptional regulator [Ligilactobacillus animalis]